MKGLHTDYPEQDFEINDFGLGRGKIIATDLQGLLTGVDYAKKNGWEILIEDNGTHEYGTFKEVRIYSKEKEEDEVAKVEAEQKEEVVKTEKTETTDSNDQTNEGEEIVDLDALANLGNNRENRKKIDDIAKGLGVELDRRKLKTVTTLVDALRDALEDKE